MAWGPERIPDLNGRTAVVTGGNGGLGLETVRVLASSGATVVIAARDLDKASAARDGVLAETSSAKVGVRSLDLCSLASIRVFADGLVAEHRVIDLLVNNAGVMAPPRRETEDGHELQFGTNHLGHFALTARLMPSVLRSGVGRVVTITSFGRLYRWRFDPGDPRLLRRYDPWRAYGLSKMANFLFALELDRRLRDAGASARSVVAHPGFTHTELQAESVRASGGGTQRMFHLLVRAFGMTPDRGVLSQVRAGTDPSAGGGEFYGPRWFAFGPPVRKPVFFRREEEAEELWRASEELTGTDFDVARMVADASG